MKRVFVVLALVLSAGSVIAATCDEGEKPFALISNTSVRGDSIAEVCQLALQDITGGTGSVEAQPWGACYITLADGTTYDEPVNAVEMCTPGAGSSQLSADFIAKILVTYFGVWALGFGVGKSVAWTRALGSVG